MSVILADGWARKFWWMRNAADARSKLRQLDLKMRGGVSLASAAIP